tara:strand:+ start:18 stop:491 length:474 start_codon:yes stop_codon:yes gene_type:complete
LDIDPSAAFNYSEEISEVSLSQNPISSEEKHQKENINTSDSIVAFDNFIESDHISGFEPVLGGQLCEKALWVDEATCIGCRYCVHVATNTFIVDEDLGRCRVIRQNGDDVDIVQEAIDTCPVDCIHWVDFEDLDNLDKSLDRDMFQSLGKLPRMNRF